MSEVECSRPEAAPTSPGDFNLFKYTCFDYSIEIRRGLNKCFCPH
jgi:hypothetical protein